MNDLLIKKEKKTNLMVQMVLEVLLSLRDLGVLILQVDLQVLWILEILGCQVVHQRQQYLRIDKITI